MSKKNCFAIAVCISLIMPFAYGQQNLKTNSQEQKAVQLLSKLEGATTVEPSDNLIGLSVDSVKKSGDDYDIYFNLSNKRITNVAAGLVMGTFFIDPENYKHFERPLTIGDDGSMTATAQFTREGTIFISLKLKPESHAVYVYFRGVKEPSELYTTPLLFVILLGEEPCVLEQTPRYAGTLFDESLKQEINVY